MTQFVEFLFSSGGIMLLTAGLLIWAQVRGRSNLQQRIALAALGVYALLSLPPVSHGLALTLTHGQRPFAASDVPAGRLAVVVLGSGSYVAEDWDGQMVLLPNQTSSERVVEAARIYKLAHPEWIITSGGRVYQDDPSSASAESARTLLIQLGVPAAKIVIDTRARTTHEESVFVGQTLKTLHPDRVILVTSDLHMPRALGAFRAQGLEPIAAMARRPHFRNPWGIPLIPAETGLEETRAVAREVLGIAYYTLRGWYRRP